MGNCMKCDKQEKPSNSGKPAKQAEDERREAYAMQEEPRQREQMRLSPVLPPPKVEIKKEVSKKEELKGECPLCGTGLPEEEKARKKHLRKCQMMRLGYTTNDRLRVVSEIYGIEKGESVPYQGFQKLVGTDGQTYWKRFPKTFVQLEHMDKLMLSDAAEIKKLPTEEKHLWYCLQVERMKKQAKRGNEIFSVEPIILLIEREFFLRDSFEQFRTTSDLDLRREVKINFVSEVSQDAGGLIRDWFSILTEELFNAKLGLFSKANTKEFSYVINEFSESYCKNHLEYFYFTGQVLAKALFERIAIKAHLNLTLVKQIVGAKLEMKDLRYFDEEIWSTFEYLRKNTLGEGDFIGTFGVSKKNTLNSQETVIELKPGGSKMPITNSNKGEFKQLYFNHLVIDSTKIQTAKLLAGFNSLIPQTLVSVLDPDEFDLFLCGENGVDLEDWQENTVYEGEFSRTHHVIANFWSILTSMTELDRERMLHFCTGSTRVPAEGFKGLRSSNGKLRNFTVAPREYSGLQSSFIVAHTCFNKIELPCFPSKDLMETSVKQLLSNPSCFQFAFE